MPALAHTFAIDGSDARHITVELDVRGGLPSFRAVGMTGATARAARERIQTAIRNSGFQWPAKRITANLSPGDVRKASAGLDLAIACAILAATEQAPSERLSRIAMFGELGLDGTVRPTAGTLVAAEAALRHGFDLFGVAPERAREAALPNGLTVAPLSDLRVAAGCLSGAPPQPLPPVAVERIDAAREEAPDLGDVQGCREAVRALVVAAAGGHNLLLVGAPGVGKTMLARRLPGIMPALDREETVELGRLESLRLGQIGSLDRPRPFRAPHHSITVAGLLGTAANDWKGEVLLSHRGVLFLDELSEFARPALDCLRQPLEDGFLPTLDGTRDCRFMLVCATNPCPCGHGAEDTDLLCTCSSQELARHRRKLGGPLLDRIDLLVGMRADEEGGSASVSSAEAAALVASARARAAYRLKGRRAKTNSEIDASSLGELVRLGSEAEEMISDAHRRGLLSARGAHRTIKVARTLADLAGHDRVAADDLATALALRGDRRGDRLIGFPC